MLRVFALIAVLIAGHAAAQSYPSKPIRLIVPLVPGGNQDIVARAMAEEMSKGLGQQVVVENRPGQSAIIGTQFVKSAPPGANGTIMRIGLFGYWPQASEEMPKANRKQKSRFMCPPLLEVARVSCAAPKGRTPW